MDRLVAATRGLCKHSLKRIDRGLDAAPDVEDPAATKLNCPNKRVRDVVNVHEVPGPFAISEDHFDFRVRAVTAGRFEKLRPVPPGWSLKASEHAPELERGPLGLVGSGVSTRWLTRTILKSVDDLDFGAEPVWSL